MDIEQFKFRTIEKMKRFGEVQVEKDGIMANIEIEKFRILHLLGEQLFLVHPECIAFEVKAATPSFNDGDVCVHYQDERRFEDTGEGMPVEIEYCKLLAVHSDLLHSLFGTNFQITWEKEGGEVVIEKKAYDCEY